MNTLFEQTPRRLYTWISSNGNTRDQIDYFIVRRRWKSSVQCVKTFPGADCGSDHQMLYGRITIRIRKVKKETKKFRYDVSDISEQYKLEVRNRFSELLLIADEKEPGELANEARDILLDAAKNHLNKKRNTKQLWISKGTSDLIDERRWKLNLGR